ncbi:P-loop containing nucleoside triphosphate hydrolase protein, partial [Aureobasidium melanogenum]
MATDGVQQDIEYVNVEDISRSEEDQKILQSYHRLSSRRVDLVGDFAGQELFAIEGDSLLLQCFENSLLDFEDGFQMLHAVYLVEDYLAQLQRRNCRFHIAFFEAHRQLCIPQSVKSINRSKYLLTRAAIIRHLKSNLQSEHVQIHCFSDLFDQAFDDYLRNSAVYFLMCHDGARSYTTQDRDVPDPRTQLRSIIVHFILSGYNVALINGSEFVDTKIMAMVLETKNLSHRLDPTLDASPKQLNGVSEPISTAELKDIETSTSDLTERERLTILTLSRLIKTSSSSPSVQQFTHDVLAHTALLHALPLSARSLQHTSAVSGYKEHLSSFCDQAAEMLRSSSWAQYHQEIEDNDCDVADVFDGRLFNIISEGLDISSMPETVQSKLQRLSECMKTICNDTTSAESDGRKLEISSLDAPSTAPTGNMSVLPFSNPVFDQHLASIRLGIDDRASEEISRPSARIFQEVSHWHNAKRPIQSKNTPVLSPRDELRARRRNQKYMDEMQKYAASLTNSVGRALEPETLLVKSAAASKVSQKTENKKTNAEPTKNADTSKKSGNPKGGKKNVKVSGKQAAQEAAAAFQAKKAEASDTKVMQAWHIILKSLSAEKDLPSRYVKTKDYFTSLPKDKREVLGAEVQLFSLSTLVEIAIQSGKTNDQDPNGIVAFIWHTARNLVECENMTKTICEKVKLTVDTFGLPPVDIPKPTQDKSLPFRFALPLQSAELVKNKLPSKAFQLLHCGPFLDRSMDAAPDSRVDFEPDGWQRKVLDGIDDNKSLFVVAPTSAGKTFISFYAMRKVIEADDEGVLVYVAPTKALVNQIAAEIQGRYSKKFKYPGKSVWAIHTRDHRINNATGCQVLVTVPHVLQIMLLAPSHANSWATRVKRIIFDEVHCIGQAQDGVVWEQLLLLAPCPVIALSATVGNPDVFSDWLSTTEKAMGIDFEMVRHPYRYSDLRKFYYDPPKKFLFDGLGQKKGLPTLGLDGSTGFEYLHPVACLVNRSAGMPDDLSFEPRDCYTLWKAMKEHSNDKYSLSAELDPANALPNVIRKQDVLKWEAGLKKVLAAWMEDTASPFNAVFTTLSGKRPQKEELYAPTAKRIGQREAQEVEEDNFLPLLCRLHEQDAMPAILFNYDRTRCEDICAKIHDDLKEAEDQWKATDPKWKAKIAQWEAWKKEQERKGAKASKVSKSRKPAEEGMTKADMQRDAADTDANGFEGFDPAAPQDGYHFCNFKAIQISELEDYMRELEWRHVPQWLIVALTRGIAVHHSGMNRKYRQVVEILFRKGFLRVVVATGTLALGINMPCKTVVFTGESVFLTALEYRQCAGRAGRRGFDLLGNVVFQNMQHEKVLRLMSSRLPDLNGHFPVTTTLVLRLFTLLHGSNNSKYAASCINSLLSQPRLYMGGPSFKDQTLHHLRFSIEYLRRQQLLDAKGTTLNFAGLVSHLYFTENSSFAFHALLKEGYFHKLCADIDNNAESVINTLMMVMSHLFGRVYCRKSDAEYREKVVKPSSSMVFLPPLPEEAAQVLNEHGKQTLDIFSTYVRTFVDQHVQKADDVLPLTARQVGCSSVDSAPSLGEVSLPSTKIRSPFVALSGHTDHFKSISELCRSVRSGVFLEESAIPHVAMLSQDLDQPLNAYLVDFFKHGDVKTLEKANGIRRGDVWFMLNDFSLVLATIITSLLNFMKLKVGSDMDFLDTMGELDTLEEAEDETVVVKEDGEAVPAPSEAPKAAMATITKKKAKNAESWEDMADEEEVIEKDYNEAAAKLDELNIDSAAWEGQGGEKGLLKVLKAFQRLHSEFNLKFKAMWA